MSVSWQVYLTESCYKTLAVKLPILHVCSWNFMKNKIKNTFHLSFERLLWKVTCVTVALKSDQNCFTALFGSDDIPLRVVSDWPFNEPMESLLPKFGPVTNGAKRKMTFDVTVVTLCKHSDTWAPFFLSNHLEMIRKCKNLKGTRPWKYWGSQVSKIWLHVIHFML